MTAAPSQTDDRETTYDLMELQRLCSKFSVNQQLLNHPAHLDTLRPWLRAMSAVFVRAERPQVDWDFRKYTGNSEPDILHYPDPMPGSRAPVLDVESNPAPAQIKPEVVTDVAATMEAEVAAAFEEPADLPTLEKWQTGHTQVHADVFRRYSAEHALAVVILRRHISRERGDIYRDPRVLAARVGVTAKTLKGWLLPGGLLSDDVWLRLDEKTHEPAFISYNDEGAVRWCIDVRTIDLIDGVDDGGRAIKTLATPADAFVRIPHCWLYVYPGDAQGDYWSRRDVEDCAGAVWAGAVVQSEARARKGVMKAVHYLAKDWGRWCESDVCPAAVRCEGCPKGRRCKKCGCGRCASRQRQVQRYLTAAEDAGFITVVGRSGKTAAWRMPQFVPSTKTTTNTRRKNGPAPEQDQPLNADGLHDPEDVPF